MSSRKTSLSGWRPKRVRRSESRTFSPACGPARTTSTPPPGGRSARLTTASSAGLDESCNGSVGWNVMVDSSRTTSRAAPHDEQKFDFAGLRWPHLLQNTYSTQNPSPVDERLIRRGVEQLVHLRYVDWSNEGDPTVAVGVLVDPLRLVGEVGVHLHDRAADRRVDVGHRLGRLDLTERLARLHLRSDGGHLHEDDVTQGILRVVGETD